ncbi:hypothetical protein [Natrinema marinum]|uniref:hypothetical protein n=1 Tax=Natrinema marinum TaxID=2961598 RepID=UPI0020C9003D|nr:hypothetical protein [Natrinema marinum]
MAEAVDSTADEQEISYEQLEEAKAAYERATGLRPIPWSVFFDATGRIAEDVDFDREFDREIDVTTLAGFAEFAIETADRLKDSVEQNGERR